MHKVMFSSRNEEWETPPDLFAHLNEVFNFTLDPCATKKNALCEKYYTKKENGLSQSWEGERVFINPPFHGVEKWVLRAWACRASGHLLGVMLIASRTETNRFQKYILPDAKAICFMSKRVKYYLSGKPHMVPEKKKNKKGKLIETGRMVEGSPAFPSVIPVFARRKLTIKQRKYLKELGYVWER
jgi:site-specific DNA-methyltransferase (adenine-specific)